MARYTGPVCRLCRREGMKLFLKGEKCLTKCTFERRSSPPGMHQQRRRKVSDFALQLREKQKARRIYGVLERQMKNTFEQAAEIKGATGEVMLQNLERRLDNTVYRSGFGKSRSQARQLVAHAHIKVNGKITKTPSYQVKAGDLITVREPSRSRRDTARRSAIRSVACCCHRCRARPSPPHACVVSRTNSRRSPA